MSYEDNYFNDTRNLTLGYTVTIDKSSEPDFTVHTTYINDDPPRRKSAEDVISANPLALKYWNRGDKRAALYVAGITGKKGN